MLLDEMGAMSTMYNTYKYCTQWVQCTIHTNTVHNEYNVQYIQILNTMGTMYNTYKYCTQWAQVHSIMCLLELTSKPAYTHHEKLILTQH